MRFLLDQNVAKVVQETLIELGHEAEFSNALVAPNADDPVVAIAAEESDAILVSHDNDFKSIAPRVVSLGTLSSMLNSRRISWAIRFQSCGVSLATIRHRLRST